jgi:23S rRNA (adenine2503-C2)-methyltransferase
MTKPNIKDMTLEEIEAFIVDLGKEKYRAKQMMKCLYQSGATSFEDMTTLSKVFRAKMSSLAAISQPEPVETQVSKDGTKKILFKLEDGLFIESVLIPGRNHWTVCVSTQAGCQMGCRFCLTGKLGFKRNLSPSEITGQITALQSNTPEGPNIKNIVMMGMGEPLANYNNTLKAIKIITSDCGLGFSGRKVTVSTCGIAPMIYQLGKDACVNLAISLNAPDDEIRSRLMPINKKYPFDVLLEACRGYNMPRRRMLTFEYALISGINCSEKHAEALVYRLRGLRCKFNLIAFNEFPGSPFKRPSSTEIERFQRVLIKNHYTAVLRTSKGSDILAACGQLSGQAQTKTTQAAY